MGTIIHRTARLPALCAAVLLLWAAGADAMIQGIQGNVFSLTARADHISTPDGGSLLIWGYADGGGRAQYPGPTFIVNQGETVTVNLSNELEVPVSMVFPGQANVQATGDSAGILTMEADPLGGTASYSFVAANAGTYLYHSGTSPELQVEMGLLGAIVVRPYAGDMYAYNSPDSRFGHEFLLLLSEMDPRIHDLVEFEGPAALEGTDLLSDYFPNYWFINGRNAPDTMAMEYVPWLPTQPYNCMPRMHPGDRMLLRIIGGGRDLHPFHHHGNHSRIIARDGRLLQSAPGPLIDLSHEVFTVKSIPGETVDVIFEWTGKNLGWDMYGTVDDGVEFVHNCVDGDGDEYDDVTWEYCPDHGKPFPVALPGDQEVTFGGFYSGSPFLGTLAALPPGEGGMNPNAGYVYMWHSHTEKEMTNFDIFPGGMMTMVIIEPHGVPIP